jgi:N-acetylglucosaminyl-diphospho-decaprenol L-rhamnosyltransferase
MTIGVLITNYKAWPTTQATLTAVINLHPDSVDLPQILVVDDASDAPTSWGGDSRVQIFHNPRNIGYVRSINVGMALMRTDLVVILDCDARPLTAFTRITRDTFTDHPDLGALGFTQTDESGALRPSGEPTPTLREFSIGPAFFSRLPAPIRRFILPPDRPSCIHSCCMAVRRAAFQDVSGFDESFDFLDGDMDFSWRLIERAWKTALTSDILCFHPGGGSPQSTSQRVLRLHQNRWRLLAHHGHLPWPGLAKTLLWIRHLIETAALSVLSQTPARSHYRIKLQTRQTLLATVLSGYSHPPAQ